MAQTRRGVYGQPGARLPQLLVTIGCSLAAFTGMWLWWFGQDTSGLIIRENDITDPYAVQTWMRRLHTFGAYATAVVVVFMIMRAAAQRQSWRTVFLFAFLLLAVVGIWTGVNADWDAARLWSETMGTKLSAGIDIGDNRRLPDELRVARSHLSVVPAAMLGVAFLSFLHYRRG